MSKHLLREFWCNPTYEDARCWGSFPYEQDQSGKNVVKLAKKYTYLNVCHRILGVKQEVDWKAGSLVLSAPLLWQLMKRYKKLKKGVETSKHWPAYSKL